MAPENQTVKIGTAREAEKNPDKPKLSWMVVLVSQVANEDFPEVETPLVAEICKAFLQRFADNASKISMQLAPWAGNEDPDVIEDQISDLVHFIQMPTINIEVVIE